MNDFLKKIQYELVVDGFSVLEPKQEIIKLTKIISSRFDSNFILSQDQEYTVNIFRDPDLKKKSCSDILQYIEFCDRVIKDITTDSYQLDAIFQTYDTSCTKHIAQDPHFDRIPTLKFMLYVNDLTNENGAFCLSPGSHHWVNERLGSNRRSHGSKGFLEASRNIPMYIKDRIVPVEGKMGTVIIFNTDCIHHQGIVQEGHASILRSHYRKNKAFRSRSTPRSIVNAFLGKLSALIFKSQQ